MVDCRKSRKITFNLTNKSFNIMKNIIFQNRLWDNIALLQALKVTVTTNILVCER